MRIFATQKKTSTLLCTLFALWVLVAPATAQKLSVLDLGTAIHSSNPADRIYGSWGINLGGQVAGFTNFAGAQAFRWDDVLGSTNLGIIGNTSHAYAINDGNRTVGDFNGVATVWEGDGSRVIIGYLPGSYLQPQSRALGLNNVGQVVGVSTADSGDDNAFIWDNAHGIVGLGIVGTARSINIWGQVTGRVQISPGGTYQTYIWTPYAPNGITGEYIVLGGYETEGVSINDSRQIVGNTSSQAFKGDANGLHFLSGLPGGGKYWANSINNLGFVAGAATTSKGEIHAVYWDDKEQIHDLNPMMDKSGDGWTLSEVRSINDTGWMVGTGFYNREWHGFSVAPPDITQIATDRLQFLTSNQSVWHKGTSGINKHYPFTLFKWDTGRFNHRLNFGLGYIGADAFSNGKVTMDAHLILNEGGATIHYPVTTKIQFPNAQDIAPGTQFVVSSSFTPGANQNFVTKSPEVRAILTGHLEMANKIAFEAGLKLLFTNPSISFDLASLLGLSTFNHDAVVLDSKWFYSPDKWFHFVIEDIVYGDIRLPNIIVNGALDNNQPQLGTLIGKGHDDFFILKGSITNIIAKIFGLTLKKEIKFPEKEDDYKKADFKTKLAAAIAQLFIGLAFGFDQELTFTALPHIRLVLPTALPWIDPQGGEHNSDIIDFNAGESIKLTMPQSNDPILKIIPQFTLPSQIHNRTTLTTRFYWEVEGLSASIAITVLDHSLGPWGFNLDAKGTGGIIPLLDIYNKTFDVDSFPQLTGAPFTVVTKSHKAGVLSQVTPAQTTMWIIDSRDPNGSLKAFNQFVAKTTSIVLKGRNFTRTTQVLLEYYGASVLLTPVKVSGSTIKILLPNKYLLLPGVARFTAVDKDSPSNSIDFTIAYPAPGLARGVPDIFASDPNPLDAQIVVSGNKFINIPDYFWSPNTKFPKRLIQKFWNRLYTTSMPATFPDFPFFDTDANGQAKTSPTPAPTVTLYWNDQPLPLFGGTGKTGFIPATLPASYYSTAGIARVYLMNPAPGGGFSSVKLTRIAAPTPEIVSLSPAFTTPGSPAFTLTIAGNSSIPKDAHNVDDASARGFVPNSLVLWDGTPRTPRYISPVELQLDVSAADVATGGTHTLAVVNPSIKADGSLVQLTSTGVPFNVGNPTPQLTSLNPPIALTGSSAFDPPQNGQVSNLSITGSGFLPTSRTFINGQERTANYISPTLIGMLLLPSDVATAGSFSITVSNPTPGGGSSLPLTLTVQDGLDSVLLAPPVVAGGNSSTGTIRLSYKTVEDTPVLLSTSNIAVTIPTMVTVPKGASTVDFTITTVGVSVVTTGDIIAKLGTVTKKQSLTVNPVALSSITLAQASIQGGNEVTGTISLDAIASLGDIQISVSSDNPNATVPASVTITKGSQSANFTVKTVAVTSDVTVTISATLNGVTKTVLLKITP